MLDALSLDQLRMFVAAAEQGSFSAAARRLNRTQSAVSEALAGVEALLGVTLFDRSGRYPVPTAAGTVLLADARAVLAGIDGLKARARSMASGVEPELAVVLDVFYPVDAVTRAATEFRERFPATPLRLFVDAMGGVFQSLADTGAALVVSGTLPVLPDGMEIEPLMDIRLVMVAAADHPLAASPGPVSRREAAGHAQVVLTDRSRFSAGRDFGVISSSTWRVSDLYAKQAFIANGLGWGGMPLHVVAPELAAGRLVRLPIEGLPPDGMPLQIFAAYPRTRPPGPAGRWLIDRLRVHGARSIAGNAAGIASGREAAPA